MEKRIYQNNKTSRPSNVDKKIVKKIFSSGYDFERLDIRGGKVGGSSKFIGIVGARYPTLYGKQVAMMLAREIAVYDSVVVSGLMYGIDLIAHESTLSAGGSTIGVLGYGFKFLGNMMYAQKAVEQIFQSKNSFLISQFEEDVAPTKWTFPNRNMLIAALCDAIIIVEAGEKSGSLITANFALELGKDVYAVPGNIFSAKSKGSNALIKDGAYLIDNIPELPVRLELERTSKPSEILLEDKVLAFLKSARKKEITYTEIVLELDVSENNLNAALAKLKFSNRIKFDGVFLSLC